MSLCGSVAAVLAASVLLHYGSFAVMFEEACFFWSLKIVMQNDNDRNYHIHESEK